MQLRPVLGEKCDISQVHVGFGTIRFVDVELPLPDEQFSVNIDNIRIGFNVFRLLYQGINPQTVSQDIVIDHPKVFIHVKKPDTTTTPQAETPNVINYPDFTKIKEAYQKQFQRLEILNRLSIIDGEIYYQFYDSLDVMLAHSIEGGFFVNKADSLDLVLTGKLFNSKQENLNILARSHSKYGTISFIKAELMNYNLRDYMPEVLIPGLKFTSGEINGELYLSRLAAGHQGFNLTGDIKVTNAAADWPDKNIDISEMFWDTQIADWNMVINQASQTVNGTRMDVQGMIYNVVFPTFDLAVESNDMSVKSLAPVFSDDLLDRMSGNLQYRCNVAGTLNAFEINSEIKANEIVFDSIPIENIYLNNRYADKKLFFRHATMEAFDNHFSLGGSIDFLDTKDIKIDGHLDLAGEMSDRFIQWGANVERVETQLSLDFQGAILDPDVTGTGTVKIANPNDSTMLDFNVNMYEKHLGLATVSQNGNPRIDGTLDLNQKPMYGKISAHELQKLIFPYWNVPYPDLLGRNVSLQSEVEGSIKEFSVNTIVNHLEGGYFLSQWATLDMRFVNDKQLRGVGNLVLFPENGNRLPAEFRIVSDKDEFKLENFNLDDKIKLELAVKNDKGGEIRGKATSKAMEIERLFNLSDSQFTGLLDFDVIMKGTLGKPELKANVEINDFTYQEMGPYYTRLDVNLDSSGIEIPQFSLNSDNVTLLYAQGLYNMYSDSLDFFVKGAGFDLQDVLQSRDEDPPISGKSLVDVNVVGSRSNPRIAGKIAVKSGNIYDVPFDEIEIDLDAGDASYPGLEIKDIRLTRHNFYEIMGRGFYPFRERDSLDIELNGEGNFLQILSDKVGFFKEPFSDGRFQARVTGSPQNPQLESASLDLENAGMYCSSVIPPIDELRAGFEFVPDDQFIHVKYVTGKMGGKPFKIHNVLSPVNSARPLENIIIGDTGLNLGILIPETQDKGIPLNIEGLMEPEVYGNLDFKGRDGEEDFYFAWIDDQPIFRGTVQLYDCELMYPFYEGTNSNPSEVVKSFFYRMEWNILVTPIQDVRYVKTFTGAIDNVYVNLQLSDKYSLLDFSGQLQDDSFRISGEARSTKGIIEYLGMDFRVDRAGAEFDKSSLEPVVYGTARTTIADSAGVPSQVFLTMQTYDVTMDKKQIDDIARVETTRGRWNDIRFKLSSNNPGFGATERQILSNLGYSDVSLQQNPAIDMIGFGTENMILRPLIRPVEKRLERTLGLDYVRFSSMFTKNLLEFNLNNNLRVNNRLSLLKSTRLVVGKYIADKVFLQYTGQVESGIDYRYKDINVGLHHRMGLEYQINPRLLLELEYDYDSMIWQRENRDDKRIVLRHWFPF